VNPRVSWTELPTMLRDRIEDVAGAYVRAWPVSTGHNCLIGMCLETNEGEWFLKGVPADHAQAVRSQASEAAINPWVRALTAPLEFRVQTGGWDVLGFRYLAGHRTARLSPGSPDLLCIAAVLGDLAAIPAPDGVPLRTIEDRWREYLGDRADLLAGPVLAHTDLHRDNIMIGATAKLVDWAWPTRAAAWIDTACVGLQLIAAGHDPASAERWCAQSPTYRAASAEATAAFVSAVHAMWAEIATQDPVPWKRDVAAAAARWAGYRRALDSL
jgi:hypothetical protein